MDSHNPFCKESFPTYRDWEDALLCFFVTEAINPKFSDWEALAQSAEPKNVAYSALILSCVVQSKPKVAKSYAVLRDICKKLGGKTDHDLVEFNEWIHTNWVNVPRMANRLKAKLAQQQANT
jgi:hypothetical protein